MIHDSHQDVHVYPNHTVVNDECKERLTPGACKAEVIVIDTYFFAHVCSDYKHAHQERIQCKYYYTHEEERERV